MKYISIKMEPKGNTPPNRMITSGSMNLDVNKKGEKREEITGKQRA